MLIMHNFVVVVDVVDDVDVYDFHDVVAVVCRPYESHTLHV